MAKLGAPSAVPAPLADTDRHLNIGREQYGGCRWYFDGLLDDVRIFAAAIPPEDVRRLAAFCAPLGRVMVNVIPYNPGTRPLTRAPEVDEVERFCGWLQEEGLPVRTRTPRARGQRFRFSASRRSW